MGYVAAGIDQVEKRDRRGELLFNSIRKELQFVYDLSSLHVVQEIVCKIYYNARNHQSAHHLITAILTNILGTR